MTGLCQPRYPDFIFDTLTASSYNQIMSVEQLLHTMCAELSDNDLNAIRKARGFSINETTSRTSFANFFVTSVGLEQVIQTLSVEEVLALRLLHETGEVDVSFFGRVYPSSYPYGTYSQHNKSIFDAVKKNLLRRGLIVMAEVKTRMDVVQLERWRFALPPEFARVLPALNSVKNDQPGKFNDSIIRQKLNEVFENDQPANPKDQARIHLKHGSLYLKDVPFSISAIRAWQSSEWQRVMKIYKSSMPASISASDALFRLLSTDCWIKPETLEPALKVYCYGNNELSIFKLLQKGWELGLFCRMEINGKPHYRLVGQAEYADETSFSSWAGNLSSPEKISVDLRRIPLGDLEQLNRLVYFEVSGSHLHVMPSIQKLGRVEPAERNSPLSLWLTQKAPAFAIAVEHVNQRWGKTILHDNLLFARVRDLSLRVQLERELKENIVLLDENFVAFPIGMRASVEKVIKKAGFVIKSVKA
jgi:hypothetical protein